MITTRERIRIIELFAGMFKSDLLESKLGKYIPIDGRNYFFCNQGKIAFEQIVIYEKLNNCKIILPAFFPDDFVGIFKKYNITPVFVDVDLYSYHLNLDLITEKTLENAKALILLHTFGLTADGQKYRDFCNKNNIILIEDCARALGSGFQGRLAGSFGQYALYSLPKCTPVRQGGICLSETSFVPKLGKAKIGIFGFLHSVALVKIPFTSALESLVYKLVADTPIYPREIGIYELLTGRILDRLSKYIFCCFLKFYNVAISKKKLIVSRIKPELEKIGFKFQQDDGNHIYTSLSAELPDYINSDKFIRYLNNNGVKMSTMWRRALGISQFSKEIWNVDIDNFPNALHLAKRLVQFPINRFQSEKQSNKIIKLCRNYIEQN